MSQPIPARSTSGRDLAVACVAIIGLVLAVYGQTGRFEFVNFDDDVHVSENPHVTDGVTVDGIVWAFGIHGPSQWHPLAWISHQIDCTLFGLDAGWHHRTNVALHLLASVLLFLALNRLTRVTGASAFVALAFAVHPLNVESVAWVSERRNVLCAVFWFGTMWLYADSKDRPLGRRWWLVCLGHAAALASKPLAITLPCTLLLLDVWPLGRRQRGSIDDSPPPARASQLILEKTPLFLLSIVSAGLSFACQRSIGTVATLSSIPLTTRVANALAAYGWYLQKFVWPINLACFYPHPALIDVDPWGSLAVPVVAGGVLVVSLSAIAIQWRSSHPWLLFGWLWYLGTLVPMIGLLQVGEQQYADRYAYIPLVGLFTALAFEVHSRVAAWARLRRWSVVAAAGCLGGWSLLSYHQASVWHDSIALFSHAVDVTGRNHWGRNNLGEAYLRRGDRLQAIEHFHAAVQDVPSYARGHYNLGVALQDLGRTDVAISEFRQALELDPGYREALQRLGAALATTGRLTEAVPYFEQASTLAPDDPQAQFNLGLALSAAGKKDEAERHLREAMRLSPKWDAPREAFRALRSQP